MQEPKPGAVGNLYCDVQWLNLLHLLHYSLEVNVPSTTAKERGWIAGKRVWMVREGAWVAEDNGWMAEPKLNSYTLQQETSSTV